MGRIGTFLKQDNPKATDAEILAKDKLANELMFLSRGNPVVYYGDEQGFTGSGGDKDARQTMFASKVADYLDDDEIGTDRTHASAAYDTRAPLYRQIAALAKLRKANPALTDGVQEERYAADGPGVYAFTRTDARTGQEYVVAFNNAGSARTATFATGSADMAYRALYGTTGSVRSDGERKVTVTVPAGSAVVYKAAGPLAAPTAEPAITLKAPAGGATGTVTVTADVDGGQLQPGRLRRADGRRQVAGPRLRRPRPLPGHPDPRQGPARRHRPALQGRRRRLGRAHRERPGEQHHRHPARARGPHGLLPGLRDRPLQAHRRRLRRLGPVRLGRPRRRRGHELAGQPPLHRPGRLRRLRLRQAPARRLERRLPGHRQGRRQGRLRRPDDRCHPDGRGVDRAGQGGRTDRTARLPGPGQDQGGPALPPRRRQLRRLGPARLDGCRAPHRLVEPAEAGED